MSQLPERAPLGQPLTDEAATQEAKRIIDNAILSFRDNTPIPAVGTAPPIPQPGRPPMSQKATDASTLMLAGGATSLMVGGAGSLVMLASGYADPLVCAILLGSPAVLVLAISRLLGRAKGVIPGDTHNHYNGAVNQHNQTINSQSSWLGKTTNNL